MKPDLTQALTEYLRRTAQDLVHALLAAEAQHRKEHP